MLISQHPQPAAPAHKTDRIKHAHCKQAQIIYFIHKDYLSIYWNLGGIQLDMTLN